MDYPTRIPLESGYRDEAIEFRVKKPLKAKRIMVGFGVRYGVHIETRWVVM